MCEEVEDEVEDESIPRILKADFRVDETKADARASAEPSRS